MSFFTKPPPAAPYWLRLKGSAVAEKKELTAAEEAELNRLWRKLVKLYHPDRFANEPDKLETYHKLTAAINLAKDTGDIELLREIAEDPHGFILRQGWAKLDFGHREELTQLRRLHERRVRDVQPLIPRGTGEPQQRSTSRWLGSPQPSVSCAPSMGVGLEVEVLRGLGRRDPSEPQGVAREGGAEGSGERTRVPTNRNRIRGDPV